MKKVFLILLFLTVSLFIPSNVYASSLNVNINGNGTFSNNLNLNVSVNDLVGFDGSCGGLCGFVGTLDYDSSKLELVGINALNGFDLTQGNRIVLYKATGVPSGYSILTLSFRNKALTNGETTTISFKNITVSDGDKDISASDTSKTIKYVEEAKKEVVSGGNTITNLTNDNGANTNVNPVVSKSSNNYLLSISLSRGSIRFKKDTLNYDVIVPYDVEEIIVKAVCEDIKSTITGTGTHELKVGSNTIKLVVKAEDGSEKTYSLNISREEEDVDYTEELDDDVEKTNNNRIIIVIIIFIMVFSVVTFIIYNSGKDDK